MTVLRPRPAPPSKRSLPRGFSLLEVMTVVTILAVMATLAVPNFQRALERTRARAQKPKVERHLRAARNAARTTLCEHQVTVDTI